MVFDLTKHYVPEVYSDSREYRVFLHLVEILSTVIKYNADHFPDLYNPADCPDNLLPYLAGMVGYDYDNGLSIDNNRIIIKYFPYLIRNRGSEIGIKLAMSLSLNIHTNINDYIILDDVQIEFDYEKAEITIYYPKGAEIRKYLLEVVRPVGMTLKLIPMDQLEDIEDIDAKVITKVYNNYDNNLVGGSQVEFDEVSDGTLCVTCAQDPAYVWFNLSLDNRSDDYFIAYGIAFPPHKLTVQRFRHEYMRDECAESIREEIAEQPDPSLYTLKVYDDNDRLDVACKRNNEPDTVYDKITVKP